MLPSDVIGVVGEFLPIHSWAALRSVSWRFYDVLMGREDAMARYSTIKPRGDGFVVKCGKIRIFRSLVASGGPSVHWTPSTFSVDGIIPNYSVYFKCYGLPTYVIQETELNRVTRTRFIKHRTWIEFRQEVRIFPKHRNRRRGPEIPALPRNNDEDTEEDEDTEGLEESESDEGYSDPD